MRKGKSMTGFEKVKKNFGFGCMRLPMKGKEVDQAEFSRMVDTYIAAGFNYFDTARVYLGGKSETAIRECIAKRYPREAFVLADKLKELRDRKSELEERAKANQAELEQVMLALSEQMAASETQSFSRSGLLFYLNSKTYAAAKAGQKFELFDALKKQGLVP